MSNLFLQDIKFLPGVGPKRAELLNSELNIYTQGDLVTYFPYKYIDRSKFYTTREIRSDQAYIQLRGKITNFRTEGGGRNKRLVADFYDDEVDDAVGNLTAMMEPLLMLFLGTTVGGLVIAMYLPIFQLAGAVGG